MAEQTMGRRLQAMTVDERVKRTTDLVRACNREGRPWEYIEELAMLAALLANDIIQMARDNSPAARPSEESHDR